ncbi:MAG TPA: hypothetical protein VFP70_07260 [Burkholderiales bacterium]|nr:hypothetical protein [Burkholderiales bacterium]
MTNRNIGTAVATAAAAALLLGFAPLARSHDALWHQLELTDGYTPSTPHAAAPRTATGVRGDQRAPGTYWDHEREITDGASPNPDHEMMKQEAAAKGRYVEKPSPTPAAAPAPKVCDPFLKQIHQSDGYSYTC